MLSICSISMCCMRCTTETHTRAHSLIIEITTAHEYGVLVLTTSQPQPPPWHYTCTCTYRAASAAAHHNPQIQDSPQFNMMHGVVRQRTILQHSRPNQTQPTRPGHKGHPNQGKAQVRTQTSRSHSHHRYPDPRTDVSQVAQGLRAYPANPISHPPLPACPRAITTNTVHIKT